MGEQWANSFAAEKVSCIFPHLKPIFAPRSTNLRIILLLLFQIHSEWGMLTHSEGIQLIYFKSRGLNVNTLCVWVDFGGLASIHPWKTFRRRTHRNTRLQSSLFNAQCTAFQLKAEVVCCFWVVTVQGGVKGWHHREEWDAIIVQRGITVHTCSQNLLKDIHSVALGCMHGKSARSNWVKNEKRARERS